MSADVDVVILDRVVARLGHQELEFKKLGLINHAQGVRAAIALVLQDVQASKQARAPLTPEDGAPIVAVTASLTHAETQPEQLRSCSPRPG